MVRIEVYYLSGLCERFNVLEEERESNSTHGRWDRDLFRQLERRVTLSSNRATQVKSLRRTRGWKRAEMKRPMLVLCALLAGRGALFLARLLFCNSVKRFSPIPGGTSAFTFHLPCNGRIIASKRETDEQFRGIQFPERRLPEEIAVKLKPEDLSYILREPTEFYGSSRTFFLRKQRADIGRQCCRNPATRLTGNYGTEQVQDVLSLRFNESPRKRSMGERQRVVSGCCKIVKEVCCVLWNANNRIYEFDNEREKFVVLESNGT